MSAALVAAGTVVALARAGAFSGAAPTPPVQSKTKLRDAEILSQLALNLALESARTGDERTLAKSLAAWRSSRELRGLPAEVEAATREIETRILCRVDGIDVRLADIRPIARTPDGHEILTAGQMKLQGAAFAWAAAEFNCEAFARAAGRTIQEMRAENVITIGAFGTVTNLHPLDAA